MDKKQIIQKSGFTLIELSIVLMIIALITGGILLGREMLHIAMLKHQMDQINQYNTAITLFREKYTGIPGDLAAEKADGFGFVPRSGERGHGDGNGVLESCDPPIPPFDPGDIPVGCELVLFWSDLGQAHFIDFLPLETVDGDYQADNFLDTTKYYPLMRLRQDATLIATTHVETRGIWLATIHIDEHDFGAGFSSLSYRTHMVPALIAYQLDMKMDDGLPMSGLVLARFAGVFSDDGGGFFFNWPWHAPVDCVTDDHTNYAIEADDLTARCQLNFRMGS